MLIVASAGLGALWWFTAATERTEVLALAEPVQRGDVVAVEDLAVAAINTDDVLATISPAGSGEVVGRVAVTDLPAGTVLTPAMFAAAEGLRPGAGVVGIELDTGDLPTRWPGPGRQ